MTDTSTSNPEAAKPASPTPEAERMHTLDVLRGMALLGIVLINAAAMASPASWFRVEWSDIGPLDYGVQVLKLFLVEGKFYTLFGFLFGIGFALQLARAERKGVGFAARFLWRMVLLYAIGLVHVVVVWDGDILTNYAACGLLLLLFMGIKRLFDWLLKVMSRGWRERFPRWLLPVATGVLLFGPLGVFGGFAYQAYRAHQVAQSGQPLSASQQRVVDRLAKATGPEAVERRARRHAETTAVYADGSYVDVVQHRIEHLGHSLRPSPFWLTFVAIFLLGAYFGRRDFIGRAADLRTGFRRLTIGALLLGVPLSVVFVWARIAGAGSRYPWWQFVSAFSKTASALALALALVGAVTLAMHGRAHTWLMQLAPIGRMALSNYLLQSVVGTTVFYGYGLGAMDYLGAAGQLLFCVALFAGQIAISRWWLARYRFGPVEWVWRSGTYLRLQPMRRST